MLRLLSKRLVNALPGGNVPQKFPVFVNAAKFRPFSSTSQKVDEPDHAVDIEDEGDEPTSGNLNVPRMNTPYLVPEERAEMFKLHNEDPKKWDYSALAQEFGCTRNRARAIIYTMESRVAMIKAAGLELDETGIMPAFPKAWTDLHEVYKRDKTIAIGALAEQVGMPNQNEEVQRILNIMEC